MANVHRIQYRLLTLRLRLIPAREGLLVDCGTYQGDEEIDRLQITADEIGIRGRLSVRDYRDAWFQFPEDQIQRLVHGVHSRRETGEPLWLQVDQSSGHLAVVPWERLIHEAFDMPILRVPNFLNDPVYVSGRPELAVCVSSPRAKQEFDVGFYAEDLVQTIEYHLPDGCRVHVFADEMAYGFLRSRFGEARDPHEVVVHDPANAKQFGSGVSDRGLRESFGSQADLDSPWLLWMASELEGRHLDSVHFICPGYFSRDRGALAVARSPLQNIDSQWSHFIGIDQLIRFLDLMGAWAVAFSPPHENVWSIGLRLLADQLAWRRPGAIMIHDTGLHEKDDLGEAYRFLFGNEPPTPVSSAALMLYCHPQRLQHQAAEELLIEGPDASMNKRVETILEGLPERIVGLRATGARGGMPVDVESPAWQRANRLLLDKAMLRLQDQSDAQRSGTLKALGSLAELFESES